MLGTQNAEFFDFFTKFVKNIIRAGPNDVGGGAIPGGFFFTKKQKTPKGAFWYL